MAGSGVEDDPRMHLKWARPVEELKGGFNTDPFGVFPVQLGQEVPRLPKAPMECIPWQSVKYTHTQESAVSARDALVHWWCSPGSTSTELLPRVPTNMLEGIAHVLARGSAKAKVGGRVINGTPWSVKFAAAMRHAARVDAGDLVDLESGLPHEWYFWGNVAVLWHFASTETGQDDRAES